MPKSQKRHREYEVSVRGKPPDNLANLVSLMHSAAILEGCNTKFQGVPTEGDANQPHHYQDHLTERIIL